MSSTLFSQDPNWILATKKDGVELYFIYNECNTVSLKVVNTTDKNITVTWEEAIVNYQDNAVTSITNGVVKSISIAANSSQIGACSDTSNLLKVDAKKYFASVGDGSSDFTVSNLTIN